MSELRFEELRGEQVAYAIDRQERTFLPPAEHCPLCPTRPGGEPTEIPFEAFEIAVFENRFPAFAAPRGAAEVVVYTDSHAGSFGTLPAARARALMWVWRHRYEELGAREDVDVRVHLREPRRRGRRHAAPPSRPDLRLPVLAARAGARACGRRAPRGLRAVRTVGARAARGRARGVRERGGGRVRALRRALGL